MKYFTIGCDFDDTMNNLLSVWVDMLNKKHSTDVNVEDIKDWCIKDAFPTLTEKEIVSPLHSTELWRQVQPKANAAEVIHLLMENGHKVYVVTSSDYRVLPIKFQECLFKHFPFLTKEQIIITYNKQLINCDILIDDAVHNIREGNYKGILIDMPHNQSYKEDLKRTFRVKSWLEIYQLINKLAGDE